MGAAVGTQGGSVKRWLAFDIGCIECGEPSAVVGVFDTRDGAKAAAKEARERQAADWHGQHEFAVFDLEDFA